MLVTTPFGFGNLPIAKAGVKRHTCIMSNRPVRAIPASAPDRLAIVEAFLNTLHVERGTDALADAIGVRAWLAESQFEVKADDLTRADRDRLVRLRAVLRVMRGDRAAAGAVPADDFA